MSKVVYTCIGLEIGLGHFFFVVSWIDLYSFLKMSKVVSPCIWFGIGLGYFYMMMMIWWWTYVLGFGIGLANISVHIYDDAYVLEFDNATSMYWIWNWIRSYLLIFQGIHMFKNFEGVTSMYWIWNWIGSYLRSCKCLNMVHPCICLNIVHPCIVTY